MMRKQEFFITTPYQYKKEKIVENILSSDKKLQNLAKTTMSIAITTNSSEAFRIIINWVNNFVASKK